MDVARRLEEGLFKIANTKVFFRINNTVCLMATILKEFK